MIWTLTNQRRVPIQILLEPELFHIFIKLRLSYIFLPKFLSEQNFARRKKTSKSHVETVSTLSCIRLGIRIPKYQKYWKILNFHTIEYHKYSVLKSYDMMCDPRVGCQSGLWHPKMDYTDSVGLSHKSLSFLSSQRLQITWLAQLVSGRRVITSLLSCRWRCVLTAGCFTSTNQLQPKWMDGYDWSRRRTPYNAVPHKRYYITCIRQCLGNLKPLYILSWL